MAEARRRAVSEITILPDGRVYVFGMTLACWRRWPPCRPATAIRRPCSPSSAPQRRP